MFVHSIASAIILYRLVNKVKHRCIDTSKIITIHVQEGTLETSHRELALPGFTMQDLEAPDYLIGPQGPIK